MSENAAEMPRYKCHKEVWALKIEALEEVSNPDSTLSLVMTPTDKRYAPFKLERQYVAKHRPEVGGYYVVYDDGYKSYSPAKAFEDGYALISR